jgi:DNA-binding SARP family transcriptional activator
MAALHFELLGDFRLHSESGAMINIPARKSQALLIFLSMRPSQLVSRDKIAGLLWSSTGPEQARQSLRQTLSTLRRELAQVSNQRILVEEGDYLALDAENIQVDAVEFESLVTRGTSESLERAAGMFSGDFLEGFHLDEERFDDWVTGERDRLHRLALRAHVQLVDHLMEAGAIDDAILAAHRSLRLDSLQEPLHRTLMRLYLKGGDPLRALQQYDTCAKVIRRELDAEPDAETKALFDEVVQFRKRRSDVAHSENHRRKAVLVVEDNLLNRQVTTAVLETAGYDVVAAKDGAEALMLMGRERVDLILLDIDLPFIDGHSVLEALHEQGIEVPAIFISGLPGEAPEVRAFELGAADFIRKPVKNSILLARVAKVLK